MGKFGRQIKLATVKQDSRAVVFKVAESSGGGFDRLDPAVESFAGRVGHTVIKVVQKSIQMAPKHLGHLLDRRKLAADRPTIPASKKPLPPTATPVRPEVSEVFFNRPRTARLQVRPLNR